MKRGFFPGWRGLRAKADRVLFQSSDLARWAAQIEARLRCLEAAAQASTLQTAAGQKRDCSHLDTLTVPALASVDRFELEAFCRARAQPAYLGDHMALCRVLGRYKLYVDTRDTGFGSNVLLDGFWEAWLTIFVARLIRPGMVAIDVGANFGYYTLMLAELVGKTGHVYAVEPNPATAIVLRRTLRLNVPAGRFTVIEAAAGAADGGKSLLYAPHGEPKNATVIASSNEVSASAGTVYTVSEVCIDSIAAERGRIDFIKIDAEGAEETIIAGAMKTLTRDKPDLVLEFNASRYRDPRAFLAQLTAIYGQLQHIDYYGNAVEVTEAAVENDRPGEDWLLFFGNAK